MNIEYINELGSGTYGNVYKAKNNGKSVAIKIHKVENHVSGIFSIKELDILARLSSDLKHPCLNNVLLIYTSDPFNNDSLYNLTNKKLKGNYRFDELFFSLELSSCKLDDFLRNECSPAITLKLFTDCLLGIEFLHLNMDIMHRDISPNNLLIDHYNNEYNLKLCDFGMSQNYSTISDKTLNITTWPYRAPEVCALKKYTKVCDIWAAGAVGFEMFCSRSKRLIKRFSTCQKERIESCDKLENQFLFEKMVNELPSTVTKSAQIYKKLFKKINISKLENPTSFVEKMKLSDTDKQNFKNQNVNLNYLEDLFEKMFNFNYEERIDVKTCLNHPLFDYNRNYINKIREDYKHKPSRLERIHICFTKERNWVKYIVNNVKNRSWFNYRLLFNSIDLFDRYLYTIKLENIDLSEDQTELAFYTCLYMYHKYYGCMNDVRSWNNFVPKSLSRNREIFEQFITLEKYIINDVCKFCIFRKSLYEICDDFSDHDDIKNYEQIELFEILLKGYFNKELNWNNKGGFRALFRLIMKINKN